MAYKDKNKLIEHNNRYNRVTYDRIGIMAPKEEGKRIRAAAAQARKSLNEFVLTAVREKMEREQNTSPVNPNTDTVQA